MFTDKDKEAQRLLSLDPTESEWVAEARFEPRQSDAWLLALGLSYLPFPGLPDSLHLPHPKR